MKRTKNQLREAWQRLTSARSLILACHQRPDGDTLGSALALARALRSAGAEAVVICEDGVPDNYEFIPEWQTVITSTDRRDFDIGVLVDSEGITRVGEAAGEAVRAAPLTACVDHHVPLAEFGDIRVIETSAGATAEIVYELLQASDVPMDQVLATQLMTGLVADTGGFRFPNTSSRTFTIAAHLTDLGADASVIAREVYESRPLRAARLLGRALSSLQVDASERVVWAVITQGDLNELGASDADTDSIVNLVNSVKDMHAALLFREIEPGVARVSLRSRRGVDVNRVAQAFGGGGHVAAAGCTVNAPIEEAQKLVVAEVLKWMAS